MMWHPQKTEVAHIYPNYVKSKQICHETILKKAYTNDNDKCLRSSRYDGLI